MRSREKIEFGDFQTPANLALEATRVVAGLAGHPAVIVEPNAGVGAFVVAAANAFPSSRIIGYELNTAYAEQAASNCRQFGARASVEVADFYSIDWKKLLSSLPEPALVLGNPPWVTNSTQGSLGGANLPIKSNFGGALGLDAKLGKSNFDVSEWMAIQLLKAIDGTGASLALLIKSSVARKLFLYASRSRMAIGGFRIYSIDAKKHFGAAVDAALFYCSGAAKERARGCEVFASLTDTVPEREIAYRRDRLVSDRDAFDSNSEFFTEEQYAWRSGVKHDLSKVLELDRSGESYTNGYGEVAIVEEERVFPLLKSSDLGSARQTRDNRWIILPHLTLDEKPADMRQKLPLLWSYVDSHEGKFAARKSSIYTNRSPFSVFGIGPYTFAPWKIAISSLYKQIRFRVVGPVAGKPVLFDDTCYLFPCWSEAEAKLLYRLLHSNEAQSLLNSLVFLDSKRVVTKDVLGCIDLEALCVKIYGHCEFKWRKGDQPNTKKQRIARSAASADQATLDLFDH